MAPLPPADQILDMRHQACPLPLLKTRQAIRHLPAGSVLQVIATDAGSRRDIPAYLGQTGHELVHSDASDSGEYRFWIRVAAGEV